MAIVNLFGKHNEVWVNRRTDFKSI